MIGDVAHQDEVVRTLEKALEEAKAAEERIVEKQYKLDSRLLKRFADFCESRALMIAEVVPHESL